MKILATSDLHGTGLHDGSLLNNSIKENNPDLIVMPGDIFPNSYYAPKSDIGQAEFIEDVFIPWVKQIDIPVVFTLGNHDYISENQMVDIIHENGMTDMMGPLINETITISGITIYGNPYSLPFCGWNYNASEEKIAQALETMPYDIDVFITHSPPINHNDSIYEDANQDLNIIGEPLGSISILEAIKEKQPKYVFCGHIHSGSHRISNIDDSKCVNVSLLNEQYNPYYKPFVITI